MYNGNQGDGGGPTRLDDYRNTYSPYSGGRPPLRVGNFTIKPAYLYVGAIILVVIAIFLVLRFLQTSLVMHYGAAAGLLLIIANLRELMGMAHVNRSSTALLNLLVAGGLLLAYISQFFGLLFWIPAIILLGIAVPLTFGRANVYASYVNMAKTAASGFRRTIGR